MWIVRYALAKPYSVAALALLVILAGFLGYSRLPVDVLPNVNIPAVKVIWTYGGLNSREMASKVTSFSEVAIMNNVDNVREIKSQTLNGVAIIQVQFQPGVDIANAMAQITSVSQTILRRLPPGTTPPLIAQYNQSSTPILQLVISSDTLTDAQLADFARLNLRGMIQTINGIRMTLPYGGASRQVMLDLKPDALYAYGVTATDVNRALVSQNLTLPSGSIREGQKDIPIAMNASPEPITMFESIPVKTVGGRMILLRDVADIRDGAALQSNIARVNGNNAVIVSLIKLGNASTVDIINQVLERLPQIRKAAPEGITIAPIFDQSVFVNTALHHIQNEIVIVGSLVAFIVLLFLGSWRATLIVLTSIPLSLLSAIFMLKLTGNTLNLMSLGGLALAIGILVDNALVEIENIKTNLSKGLSPRIAALTSAQQVAFPELVSTISICIVFSPIFLLTGVSGYIFQPLAIVVIASLVMSYILSRTVVPVLAVMLLPKDTHGNKHGLLHKLHLHVESLLDRGQRLLNGTVGATIGKPVVPIIVLLVLLAGVLSFNTLGRDFFPKIDAGLMRFYVRTEAGTRIEETAKTFAAIQHEMRSIIPERDLEFIVENIGTPDPINLGWVDSFAVGSYDGEILIQLKKGHAPTSYYEQAIRQMLLKKFTTISIFAQPADTTNQTLAGTTPTALDIQFTGRDVPGNMQLARTLMQRLKSIDGAVDIGLQQVVGLPEYFVSIDRERAAYLGVNAQEALSNILGALGSGGTVNANFWSDPSSGFSYAVQAQTPVQKMDNVETLLNLRIPSTVTSDEVPLSSFATVTPRLVPASIGRTNLQPTINVLLNTENTDLGSIYSKVVTILDNLKPQLKPGNNIRIMGQADAMQSAYHDLLIGFMMAVFFIYIIMLFNFASWVMPLVALGGAPVAVSGASFALLATGTPLSVPALMGFIMVIGVSTANSVLVTSFARDLWLSGMSAERAARKAAAARLRPVLMTALTMILGVVPMALALGEGAEQNAPLARAVIGGLLLGTMASLVFIPWLFAFVMGKVKKPASQPHKIIINKGIYDEKVA